jgi:uncharacterized protein (DUF3084 family)
MPTRKHPRIVEVTPEHLIPKVEKLKKEVSTLSTVLGLERRIKTLEKRRAELKDENDAATADLLIIRSEAKTIMGLAEEEVRRKAEELNHLAIRQKQELQREDAENKARIAAQREKLQKDLDALEAGQKELSKLEADFSERETALSALNERIEFERGKLDGMIQGIGEREVMVMAKQDELSHVSEELARRQKTLTQEEKNLASSTRSYGDARTRLSTDMAAAQRMAQEAQRSKQSADEEWGRVRLAQEENCREMSRLTGLNNDLARRERELADGKSKLQAEDRRIQSAVAKLERMRVDRETDEQRLRVLRSEIQRSMKG